MITIMVAGTVIQWTRQGRLPRFPASLNFDKGKADARSSFCFTFLWVLFSLHVSCTE